MSEKAEISSPDHNHKTTPREDNFDAEYEELTQKVFKNPSVINSFPSDPLENNPPIHQKRSSIFFKKKSTKDDRHDRIIYEDIKNEKKVILLKNYNVEATRDPKSREDYLILLSFICLHGDNPSMFNELKEKSPYLSHLIYTDSPKEILTQKNYISQVLISAANQKEESVVKEIIKVETFGYSVSIPVVLAFVKSEMHALLKPLMKVMDSNYKTSLKVLRGLIPDNLTTKNNNNTNNNNHPLQLRNTLKNMGNGTIEDPNVTKKPLFNQSVAGSEHESLIKDMKTPDISPQKAPVQEQDFFVKRGMPAKSAYTNVIIDCKFENILPYLIQMNKTDIVESLIDSFGENKVNHLNLLIMHQQEAVALRYYKRKTWDLTEAQALSLCNKRMWTFLCNIDDELDKNLFFSDNVFANMKEMLSDGKILTELVLFFMTLPMNGWRQNQAVALMELASGLLKEDPDLNRLVYASNPILTCAQLSFLLKNLAERFRFIQNDLEVLSQKLQNVAFHLQHGYRENNLYSLYLKALPTGLTMLDYIMQMGMKDLVETKFTKGLVLELWDNDSLVTGSKKQISSVYHSVQLSKKFQWKPNFVPKLSETFSFEFGNVITSAKYLLGTDLAFLIMLYIILDVYIYDKISFFASAEKDPTLIYNIPDYTFDVCYHLYPFRTVFLYILLLNYWVFFGVRTIHIFRESRKRSSYSTAYLSSFLLLTLTLISILIFPSYESQLENHIFIKLILVFTRTAIAFTIGTSLLGFQKSGQTITVVATVTTSLCVILGLLVVVILLIAEVMNNFFRKIYWFSSVKESFFTLVEILFGSITFINQHDVEDISNIYYTSNMFILIYSFVSTLLTTFLLIAYLTSIYEAVRTEASYFNTLTQYNYMQIYANLKWKGFITFPPVIYVAVLPLFLIQRIQRFAESTNELLMKAVFFMTWVFFQVMKYIVLNSFYHGPILYFKNLMLICSGKMNVSGSKILHFVGWLFGGVFAIGYYMFIDLKVLLKVCVKDFSITPPQEKLLLRVTDDDVIYLQRYESLRAGLMTIMKENPDIKNIQYLELLNFLMNGGKIKTSEVPRSVLIKKETGNNKQRLVELIRKHAKRLGGSKWLKSIYDAKKKFYRELLDGFLSYKTRSMKIEDATIDPKVVLEMLAEVSEENIVYVRARQIFAIQLVLLNTQSKEQISTMNKIEELEKKIDNLFRIYVQLYGENKDFKWSRIIDVAKEQKSNPSAVQSVPQDNMEGGRSTVQYSAIAT